MLPIGVTSAQVAAAAGVSRATVSYVLNNTPGQTISATTRELVEQAARELGYRPSAAARSLRSGKGLAVLFPLPGLSGNHVIRTLFDACAGALAEHGLSLVPDHATYPSTDAQLDAWLRLAPCAVVDLVLRHDDPVLAGLRRHGVAVLSSTLTDDSSWESTSDAYARTVRETQVRYLLDQGCRDLALLLPPRIPGDPRVAQRLVRRLRQVASDAGAELTVTRLPLEVSRVRELVDGWSREGRPDAVATFDDDYALALLTALQHRGVKVPDDIRVIGVDDVPLSQLVTPSLTTIGADFAPYARHLAAAVVTAVHGGATPPPLPLPAHRVVVRDSA